MYTPPFPPPANYSANYSFHHPTPTTTSSQQPPNNTPPFSDTSLTPLNPSTPQSSTPITSAFRIQHTTPAIDPVLDHHTSETTASIWPPNPLSARPPAIANDSFSSHSHSPRLPPSSSPVPPSSSPVRYIEGRNSDRETFSRSHSPPKPIGDDDDWSDEEGDEEGDPTVTSPAKGSAVGGQSKSKRTKPDYGFVTGAYKGPNPYCKYLY